MERKQFLKLVSTGAVCGSLIPLLQSCASYRYVNGTVQGNQLVVSKIAFEENDFVLVRNPQSKSPVYLRKDQEEHYTALLLECTHKQCTVNPAGNTLDCPCHGSRYDLQGKVLEGPARKELFQYDVQVKDDQIFIQLPGRA